ncbi:MAG: PAS domain S-box protein [Candidatus Methylumidiphilus sp.]
MTNLKPSQTGQIQQTSGSNGQTSRPVSQIYAWAGALSVLAGGLALIGWQCDIAILKSIKPEWVPMKPNAALCFMLTGVALLSSTLAPSVLSVWLSRLCASLVGLIGLLTLAEYVFTIDLAVDQLVYAGPTAAGGTAQPVRMASGAAFCFMLLASALWVSTVRRTTGQSVALAVLGTLVASFALAGILASHTVSITDYGWWGLPLMAVSAAVLLILLGTMLALEAWWQSRRLGPLSGKLVAASAGWSVLLVGSLAWNLLQEATYTLNAATAVAHASINQELSLRHWVTSHGGVYVRPTDHTPPNPYLNVPERDVTTTTGTALTLMNPEYMLREMRTDFDYTSDVRNRVASLTPINPDNAADAWEADALARFGQGSLEAVETRLIAGQAYLRLMLPFVIEPGCLKCHAQQGYKLGDIRGGIATSVSLMPYLAGNHTRSNALALTHGLVWLVGLAGFGFAYRREHLLDTERQAVAEALYSTKERFRIAAETSNDLIYEWGLGQSLQWFGDIEKLLGYDLNEFPRTLQAFVESLHPDDAESVMAAVHAQVRQGIPYATEYRIQRKDGTYSWWTARGLAERSADGKPVRMIGTVTDITRRKQAEDALHESEARFRAIFEQSFHGVAQIISKTGRIVLVNQKYCDITGYSHEELLQASFQSIIHPDDLQADRDNIQHLIAGETQGFALEKRYYHKKGHIVWVNLTVSPIWLPGQKPTYHIAVVEDISARKQMEERLASTRADLERSNRELEQFAYIASHDLQEPLRMIASYTQLLAQRYEGQLDDKAQKYIGYAVDGATRMQRLINDLLEYSRVSTRAQPPGTVDAEKILAEVKKNLSATLLENQATVTHDDLPAISVDATQFLQLLQNLIGNAIKFRCEDAPQIHISARDCGNEWLFSVRDNGIGFEAKFAERIFVIFQRLHTRQEYPGTGIGLAICKRIVERHGGKIWCESVPGLGTTFYFTIPKSTGACV